MITTMAATDARAAADKSPPNAEVPVPAETSERMDWLFRDARRHQLVHPLMDLVRRYRKKEAA